MPNLENDASMNNNLQVLGRPPHSFNLLPPPPFSGDELLGEQPLLSRKKIQIFVKTLRGNKTIALNVDPSDSVEDVKQLVWDKEGVPSKLQRLTWGDKHLEDSYTLQDYSIENESNLFLSLSLKGGSYNYGNGGYGDSSNGYGNYGNYGQSSSGYNSSSSSSYDSYGGKSGGYGDSSTGYGNYGQTSKSCDYSRSNDYSRSSYNSNSSSYDSYGGKSGGYGDSSNGYGNYGQTSKGYDPSSSSYSSNSSSYDSYGGKSGSYGDSSNGYGNYGQTSKSYDSSSSYRQVSEGTWNRTASFLCDHVGDAEFESHLEETYSAPGGKKNKQNKPHKPNPRLSEFSKTRVRVGGRFVKSTQN